MRRLMIAATPAEAANLRVIWREKAASQDRLHGAMRRHRMSSGRSVTRWFTPTRQAQARGA